MELIIDHCHWTHGIPILYTVSLVCRSWVTRARYHLFRVVWVTAIQDLPKIKSVFDPHNLGSDLPTRLSTFTRVIINTPSICPYVQTISLSRGCISLSDLASVLIYLPCVIDVFLDEVVIIPSRKATPSSFPALVADLNVLSIADSVVEGLIEPELSGFIKLFRSIRSLSLQRLRRPAIDSRRFKRDTYRGFPFQPQHAVRIMSLTYCPATPDIWRGGVHDSILNGLESITLVVDSPAHSHEPYMAILRSATSILNHLTIIFRMASIYHNGNFLHTYDCYILINGLQVVYSHGRKVSALLNPSLA